MAKWRAAAPGAGRDIKARVVSGLGGAALTGVLGSARWTVRNQRHWDEWGGQGRPAIYALWHGRLLPCSYRYRNRNLATLISHHRDGDYIAGVVERWWGFRAVRGSSSRGGTAALRQIVKILREGTALAITPDGPRGPRQTMKPGPMLAAQIAGVPVIPVTAGADRGWWIESWDRFLIPKPFSRIILDFGEPVFVPRSATESEIERLAEQVERSLNELTAAVDAELGH